MQSSVLYFIGYGRLSFFGVSVVVKKFGPQSNFNPFQIVSGGLEAVWDHSDLQTIAGEAPVQHSSA